MTAIDLFLQLTAGGCTLSRLDGDRLQIRDPQHILTDALRQAIRTHKAALLTMLTLSAAYPSPDPRHSVGGARGRVSGKGCGICYVRSARRTPAPTVPSPRGETRAAGCAA